MLGTASLAGCSVGDGSGAARGMIFEYGCSTGGDYCSAPDICGTQTNPVPYDLGPSFFAGEPINDLRNLTPGTAIMSNRLIIRMQSSGKQIEQNDVLTFDIASSYEVARCVRGHISATGQNDWDESNCYRATEAGPGRMRVQYDSNIHAALILKATCTANLVASAISAPVPDSYATVSRPPVSDGSWSSWVEFQEFGSASQADIPASERDPIKPKFRIELGDRIFATAFLLTLVDDKVVTAAISNLPKPPPEIGGTLGGDPTTGRFDFDLQRGQGAQFFP
jgi:hypothetical protein